MTVYLHFSCIIFDDIYGLYGKILNFMCSFHLFWQLDTACLEEAYSTFIIYMSILCSHSGLLFCVPSLR